MKDFKNKNGLYFILRNLLLFIKENMHFNYFFKTIDKRQS